MKNDSRKMKSKNCEIAVVGVGCIYPGANSPLQFWENILSRRQQFRKIPEQRLPEKEYYNPDPTFPDTLYQNKAAVIDGYSFDWLNRRIPKGTYESTDIVHWLALDTTLQALADAGLDNEFIHKDTTGVIFGNTLTGEFTRSNNMRLRWPYVRKALRSSLKKKGLERIQDELEPVLESYYKSVFPEITEDSLAGGLANTIAGRICNYLDLHGGGYIVDGACSSSLLAITNAANYLEMGQMDMVIAGGVDVSLDTFELIGFAKTSALTKDEMRVYDKRGNGFIPGEGCGVVVLKRLEDAISDKNTVYAIIKGWGISSDGKGGITAPSAIGQSMALKRAYKKADFDAKALSFIEGHGTGTTRGDKTELEGISIALEAMKDGDLRSCGVTSLKSIVGHTKAAAGVGAFIKTVIALNQRVLPPTAGIQEFNPVFNDKAKHVYPIIQGQVMKTDSILYAGVSAMGFGGINSHILLQSGDLPVQKFKPSLEVEQIMETNQSQEVFFFAATNENNLISSVGQALENAQGISYGELADFAFSNNSKVNFKAEFRASVIAATPLELLEKLDSLLKNLKESSVENYSTAEDDTIAWGKKRKSLRIGGVFPGQGSQQLNMARKLIKRHPWAKELTSHANEIFKSEGTPNVSEYIIKPVGRALNNDQEKGWKQELKQTNIAQPAITLASLLWQKNLKNLGIELTAVTGHSLGELMAFHSSGYFDEDTLLKFAAFRGKTMADSGSGAMASLSCNKEKAQSIIKEVPGYLVIANINSPEQTVVSGDEKTVDLLVEKAAGESVNAIKLPVSAAFHSKLVADTASVISSYNPLTERRKKSEKQTLVSSVSGNIVPDGIDLNKYFSKQAVNQVNFIAAIKAMKTKCDVMVEIGPGRVLSGLTGSIQSDIKCFPVESQANSDLSIHIMLANLFVMGVDINISELYKNRLIREFVPANEKDFIVNPCERPFPNIGTEPTVSTAIPEFKDILSQLNLNGNISDEYWGSRADFIREMVSIDMKHFTGSGNKHSLNGTRESVTTSEFKHDSHDNDAISDNSIEKVLYGKIEEVTGFPADNYTSGMKLLDDFNLDSIKAGSLLNNIFKTFQLQGKLNAVNFSNASLANIINACKKQMAIVPENGKIQVSSNLSAIDDVENKVYSLITHKTGFPREQLKPGFRLLDDLNLDSIKAGALLTNLIKEYTLQGKVDAAAHSNASIHEIITTIKRFIGTSDANNNTDDHEQKSVQQFLFNLIVEKTGFPAEQLKLHFKLLDDLNLDSIKASGLMAAIIKQYKLQGKIEAAKYANASLNEIVTAVENNLKNSNPVIESNETGEETQNWVRSFTAQIIHEPLEIRTDVKNYWKNRKVALLSPEGGNKVSQVLKKSLSSKASFVQLIKPEELENVVTEFSDILVILPECFEVETIDLTVKLFAGIARYKAQDGPDIVFIQFGDGYFNKNYERSLDKMSIVSSAGFAASVHLERPNSRIQVLEFDRSLPAAFIESAVMNEYAHYAPFKMAGYNKHKKRIKLEYETAGKTSVKRKNLRITSDDVIVISGGAKGITAECGLAMAKKYQCKVALIGSSEFKGQPGEIKTTLKKYEKEGLVATYFACDITDKKSTKRLIGQIEKRLGEITGIIHGAGKNIPRRAEMVSFEDAINEISPKVKGAFNLYESVNKSELKLFVGLTSIIGVTGMPGNGWYAFSNEALDLYLRKIRNSSDTETVSLAYSVWSEVGMGERMGSTKTLANMGIGAIQPQKGVDEFLRWIENAADDQQLVIASQLGGLDTWYRKKPDLKIAGRYIENITSFEPGIYLKVRSKLNIQTDQYVIDHDYKGSLLFPTVFGLEAMAQAVALVTGKSAFSSLQLENISLLRPIVVPTDGDTEIEINASVVSNIEETSEIRVQVGISTEQTGFTTNHFSALFILDENSNSDEHAPTSNSLDRLAVSPVSDLYSWLLFQGPRFQLIDGIYEMKSGSTKFITKMPQNDGSSACFPTDRKYPFVLGNPLLRDTLLQSVQLTYTKKQVLPIGIERWEFFDIENQMYGGEVQCKMVNWNDDTGSCDVLYLDNQNRIIERIKGYKVKAMEPTANYPDPEEIATGTSEIYSKFLKEFTKYHELTTNKPEIVLYKHNKDFNTLNKEERRAIERKVFHEYASTEDTFNFSEKQAAMEWEVNGKPKLNNTEIDISISHSRSLLLMSFGAMLQGCDIELVEKRTPDDWKTILNAQYTDTIEQLLNSQQNNDLDQSCTRIWTVKETLMKAYGFIPVTMNVYKESVQGIVFEVPHWKAKYYVLTYPVELFPNNTYMVALIIEPKINKLKAPGKVQYNPDNIYDQKSKKFITQFYTTFKDCKGFFGKTYFTDYPLWMGNLREHILTPVKKQLLKDLGSGEFGMVTNDSTIKIYNEAETLDKITGKLWITRKSDLRNSLIDLRYEWFKRTVDGRPVKLADCELSTTWVKIENRGIVKISPIPTYFYDFLESHQRKVGNENEIISFKNQYPDLKSLGELKYESKARPRPDIQLNSKSYQTGIYNSNTVGNLYYSNYYDWQAKNIESFFYSAIPELYLENGKMGEYLSLESNITHLQEAMPFEDIYVNMYLEQIFECGMKLYFEFFSADENHRRKLAYGYNFILWAKRTDEEPLPKATALPEVLIQTCFQSKEGVPKL